MGQNRKNFLKNAVFFENFLRMGQNDRDFLETKRESRPCTCKKQHLSYNVSEPPAGWAGPGARPGRALFRPLSFFILRYYTPAGAKVRYKL